MRMGLGICIVVLLCISMLLPAAGGEAGPDSGISEYAPGEVLVKFEEDPGFREAHILERIFLDAPSVLSSNSAGTNAINRKAGILESERLFREGNTYKLKVSANSDIEEVVKEYGDLLEVEYAEPNYIYEISATTPDDTSFGSQWSLNQTSDKDIDAPEAWDIELGNTSIIIAVIDTGVDWDHPDLSGHIWNNTDEDCDGGDDDDGNGYDDDCRGYDFVNGISSCWPGEDCQTEDNNPMDFHGHGTHCSGIVSAVTNNSVGIAGTCWNCTIMPVRAGYKTTSGGGSLSVVDIAQALQYAADNGAHVISMSFGGSHSSTMQDAMDYAYGKGVVLIASAGNDNTDAKSYPAAYSNVIAVSSTTSSDGKSSSSTYGPWVDVAAPGNLIYSTCFDDTYCYQSGTSMSAPHVAGLAGLILSHNSSFSQEQVRSIIKTSVDVIGFSVYMGSGRINAHKAVQINSTPVAALDQDMGDSDLTGSVQIDGTANGTGFLNYSVYYGSGLYPSSWTLINNYTQEVNSSSLTDWSTAPLANGDYTIWLSVFDTSGQEANETLPVTLSNTQTPPSFSDHGINTTPNETQDVELNATITDDYFIDTVIIELTNQNTSSTANYTVGTNVSAEWYFVLDNGNYSLSENITWFWYANDTAGNLNSSGQQEFIVALVPDTMAPNLFNYSINATPNEDQDVELNVTVTDVNSLVDAVIIEITNNTHTINYTVTTNASNEWYFVLNQGNYTVRDNITWFWYANDTSNNLNSSGQRNFTVANQAPPTPVHSSPSNNSNSSSNTLTLQWSASTDSDAEDNVTYYLYINDTLNTSTASLSAGISFPEGQWNWNLTADDGYDNSSRSSDWSFIVDTTPIGVINYTDPTPGNGSLETNNYIYINTSLSENPSACLLEWYDATTSNETMNRNTGLCYRNMTGLAVYNYSFRVWANDSAGNWNSSALRTVDLSTGAPSVNVNSPDDSTWENSSNVTIIYSTGGTNLDSCSIYLNISGWGLNQSNTSPIVGSQDNFTLNLPDGQYFWNIICNNSGGSESWYPSNLTLHVDTIFPDISILYPENRTYSQAPELNFSYSDSNPDSCWYWNGTGNTTVSGCANGTAVPGSEGQNHLILYMNDSAGNTGSDSLYWTFDTIRPLVILISPDNASTWSSSSTVSFQYNASDTGIANCSLILDGSLDQTGTSIAVNSTQTFSNSPGNGNHVWQVNCTDLGGLENSSLPWNLTVSYSPPSQVTSTGGGGGGMTETPESSAGSAKSWGLINPGAEASITVGGAVSVSGIKFSTNEKVIGAELAVEALAEPPQETGSPEGEGYQFLEISHRNLDEERLETVTMEFSVNMSWINGNMIDIATIAMNRHSGGEWQGLPTRLLGRNSEQANFTAETPGFSYFAVTGEKSMVIHTICSPGERRCEGNELQSCGEGGLAWTVLENCTQGCNASSSACIPKPPEEPSEPGPPEEPGGPSEPQEPPEGEPDIMGDYTYHILALVILIMALTMLLYYRKNKEFKKFMKELWE